MEIDSQLLLCRYSPTPGSIQGWNPHPFPILCFQALPLSVKKKELPCIFSVTLRLSFCRLPREANFRCFWPPLTSILITDRKALFLLAEVLTQYYLFFGLSFYLSYQKYLSFFSKFLNTFTINYLKDMPVCEWRSKNLYFFLRSEQLCKWKDFPRFSCALNISNLFIFITCQVK